MIDPRAIIEPGAKLAANVTVGPFSIIGPEVEIGEGTVIGPHVVLRGPMRMGKGNKVFQFSSLGEEPQDKKYQGEITTLEIGDNNIFREFTTVSRGTAQDKGITKIGNDNLFMAYVHVAHDCIVHNHTVFANNASLAGHVTVQDHVILGGFVGVHQFCVLGTHSFCAGGSIITKDVLPFTMVSGHPAQPHGLNLVGLKRRGFSAEVLLNLKQAYKLLYRSDLSLEDALLAIQQLPDSEAIQTLVTFLQSSVRSITR